MLDNMHDGMVFVNSQLEIFQWNRGAERLTGIMAEAVYQRTWLPSLLKVRDEKSRIVADADCPVMAAITTGVQSRRRLSVAGRNNRRLPIYLHAIPVVGRDGTTHGATIIMNDASSETSLER